MIKNSSHLKSTEYQIICLTSHCVSRWQALTIFKLELSKSVKLCLEAVYRKLKFKVPSTNICIFFTTQYLTVSSDKRRTRAFYGILVFVLFSCVFYFSIFLFLKILGCKTFHVTAKSSPNDQISLNRKLYRIIMSYSC